MFFSNSVNNHAKKTILTAPLDWGLGHATRCIPIIRQLNKEGHKVIIAADSKIRLLLQQEFPENLFVDLQGYNVRYTKNGFWLPIKLIFQIPKVVVRIIKEHHWLKNAIKSHNIDTVISDNRFGLFNKGIFSVYITHQLNIKTGNFLFEIIGTKIHRWFIKQFNECWVPDFKDEPIAGILSHPKNKPTNVKYIGCLSRFEAFEAKKRYDLLILISGPEPQRTIFEKLLLVQLEQYKGKILFVRGLPGDKNQIDIRTTANIIFKNHLNTKELNQCILESGFVICRSGYTTIMDLVKLNKKAVLVPTTGQAEQIYLAEYLNAKKVFPFIFQHQINLDKALNLAEDPSFKIPLLKMNLYKEIMEDFTVSL